MSAQPTTKEYLHRFALKKLGRESEYDLCSRQLAILLDEQDDLKDLRNLFHIPKAATLPDVDQSLIEEDEDSIYMCGNSLGLMPKCTEELMQEQFKKWSQMGVFGHFSSPVPWAHCDEHCIEGICKLVGAQSQEIAMMNGLTVNIHLLLTAFYKPTTQRHKILLEAKAFPSDHYAIESQIRLHGLDTAESMICLKPKEGEDLLRTEDILAYISQHGDSIALVFFSGVQYYTGQLFEIYNITKAGQQKGCLVGWDMAHAFANVPLQLHDWGVDFACWCTYKYGCSGAGGLGGVFVHSRYANDLGSRERMLGWWSHKMSTRFLMTNELELDQGANGFRISNPSFMLAIGMLGSLQVFSKTSIEALRKKSLLLTGYLEYLINCHLGENVNGKVSCQLVTPRDPQQRGCQLSLKFNCDIKSIYLELVKRGIAVDKRYPHVIRVAPVHLYNSFEDVWRFVDRLLASIKAVNQC